MKLSHHWSERYIRCMRKVWSHPQNDQRAAVLGWLPSLVPAGSVIVDIGAGDGYYSATLRPRQYLFVEPVPALSKLCVANLADIGVEAQGFRTVTELFESGRWESADIVLLIHALLYLTSSELKVVARMASGCACAMVYPSPDRSATVAFEDAVGRGGSRRMVDLKERLLGFPTRRQTIDTHFRFHTRTRASDVAFVLSHLLLRGHDAVGVLDAALSHVREKRSTWWRRGGGWEVPQPQLMEYWSRVEPSRGKGNI